MQKMKGAALACPAESWANKGVDKLRKTNKAEAPVAAPNAGHETISKGKMAIRMDAAM